jgi:hypothetical protein
LLAFVMLGTGGIFTKNSSGWLQREEEADLALAKWQILIRYRAGQMVTESILLILNLFSRVGFAETHFGRTVSTAARLANGGDRQIEQDGNSSIQELRSSTLKHAGARRITDAIPSRSVGKSRPRRFRCDALRNFHSASTARKSRSDQPHR